MRRRASLGSVIEVDPNGQEPAFGKKLWGVCRPNQSTGSDLPLLRQVVNCRADGREPRSVENPNGYSRCKQRNNKLDQKHPGKRRPGEDRHTPRRQRTPCWIKVVRRFHDRPFAIYAGRRALSREI